MNKANVSLKYVQLILPYYCPKSPTACICSFSWIKSNSLEIADDFPILCGDILVACFSARKRFLSVYTLVPCLTLRRHHVTQNNPDTKLSGFPLPLYSPVTFTKQKQPRV